jgi:hypothetical protein
MGTNEKRDGEYEKCWEKVLKRKACGGNSLEIDFKNLL